MSTVQFLTTLYFVVQQLEAYCRWTWWIWVQLHELDGLYHRTHQQKMLNKLRRESEMIANQIQSIERLNCMNSCDIVKIHQPNYKDRWQNHWIWWFQENAYLKVSVDELYVRHQRPTSWKGSLSASAFSTNARRIRKNRNEAFGRRCFAGSRTLTATCALASNWLDVFQVVSIISSTDS